MLASKTVLIVGASRGIGAGIARELAACGAHVILAARTSIAEDARSFIKSISRVCQTVDLPGDNHVGASWPSHIYFEDINGESHFDLVEIVLEEVYRSAPLRN